MEVNGINMNYMKEIDWLNVLGIEKGGIVNCVIFNG